LKGFKGKKWVFKIHPKAGKDYILYAETEGDLADWINKCITCGAKKL